MNKKLIKTILLITLLFLMLAIVSANEVSDNSTICKVVKYRSDTHNVEVEKNCEKVVEKKNIKKEENTKTATESEDIEVNDFSTFHDTLTSDIYDTITMNIKSDIRLDDDTEINKTIKNLTINGNGKTINGDDQYRFLKILSGTTVTINNIKITNCSLNKGGAIFSEGTLTITNSTLNNNTASTGGAIHNQYGNLTIQSTNLTNNTAEGDGGAIYNQAGILTITNTNLTHNNATTDGGAIYNYDYANMTLINSNLTNNTANSSGGAIKNYYYANMNLTGNNLTHNTAKSGGAIDNYWYINISLTNNTLTHNTANSSGGAIYNYAINMFITDTELTNNTAEGVGGAIYSYYSTLNINNSNLNYNKGKWGGAIANHHFVNMNLTKNTNLNYNNATWGGAIYNYEYVNMSITDTKLTYNNATWGGAIYNNHTSTINITNNTLYNNTVIGFGGAIYNDQLSKITIIASNLQYNTATEYYGGAIYNNNTSTMNLINTKLKHNTAKYSGGAIYNEQLSKITIIASNLQYNTANIWGGGAITNNNANMTLINNTLAHNTASWGGTMNNYNYANITLTGNNITHNTANQTGGAIHNFWYGKMNLTGNNITHNTANNSGGAINNYDWSNMTLTDNNITHNTANYGGAIDNSGNMTLTGNNITHNTANNSGGAINNHNDKVYNILDTTFYNNTPANFIINKNNHIELKNTDNFIDITNFTLIIDNQEHYGNGLEQLGQYTIPADAQKIKLILNGTNKTNDIFIIDTPINLKIPTKLNSTPNNKTVGETELNTILTDKDGNPIPNAQITVTLPNGTKILATTNNDGKVKIALPLPVGEHNIKVEYSGNITYEPANQTINVNVQKIPTTTTIAINGNTIGNITVTGRVTDKNNKPVNEGRVIIINNNTEIGRATISNGQYSTPLNIDTQGIYNIVAQYMETNTYLPSNANLGTITVNPRASQITGKPKGSIAGTTNITVTLKDLETGKPITNAPITVTLPNGTKIPATTDNNGNVKIPVDIPKGNNKVKIDYPGNQTYKPSSTTVDIPVIGKTPTIQITPEGDKIGNSSVITVLTDPITGKPIPNAPITVTLPNGNKVPAPTGHNGSVKIPLDLKNTTNNVTIDYPGNGTYNPLIIKINIKLDKNDPIIKLNQVRGIIGEDITLTAYLTDTDGIPINGGNLAFKLNGKTLRSDGRFDSKAPAMKFKVENGVVTYTIKADLYLRNAKNLTASYSGNYKYYETTSPSVTAHIQKRYAQVTVTSTPSYAKQYETLTFIVKAKDTTKNGKNNTLIYTDTKVILKVNGVTLKDAKGKILYLTLDKNAQTTYKYTIPKGTGGITASKKARNYTVTAIFVGDNYYPGAKNTTKFQVARSATYVNITQAKATKNNILTVKATLKDYKGNNLIGTNKVTIKINGKNYIDPKNDKAKYWSVKNGIVNLTGIQVDSKTTIKRIMLVTGERQAYTEGRAETTNITRT